MNAQFRRIDVLQPLVSGVGMLLIGLTLTGCEVWLDVDTPQCKTSKDCVGLLGRGYTCGSGGVCLKPTVSKKVDAGADAHKAAPLPARWACLDQPPEPIAPDRNKTVKVRFDVVDFTTLQPPPQLTADACGPSDVECAQPLLAGVKPDADGFFDLKLPYAFQGFFKFRAPNIVPAFSYTNRTFTDDISFAGPSLVSPATLMDIAAHSSISVDTTLGVGIIEITDCDGNAADGVHFDNKNAPDNLAFYFDGALPARDLQATTISTALGAARAPRAVGGFSNLQAGYVTFEATLLTTGTFVGQVTVQIRNGFMTYMRIYPGY
jgi:hypothetical protein